MWRYAHRKVCSSQHPTSQRVHIHPHLLQVGQMGWRNHLLVPKEALSTRCPVRCRTMTCWCYPASCVDPTQHSLMSAVSTTHLQTDSNSTYMTLGLSASLTLPPPAAPQPLATISHLGGPGDHVLDEVPVARCVNDGDVVLGGLELPQGDVNSDATFTLSLQLVQHPGVFEGPLPHLANTKARAGEKPKPIALVPVTHPPGHIPSSHRQRVTLQTLKARFPKFNGNCDLFNNKYR